MFRTYLCADSEEAKIEFHTSSSAGTQRIRMDVFEAVVAGYLAHMKVHLTEEELQAIIYAGKYMIYMQGLRFLTDYLLGDDYYKISHPQQNFDRAVNQLALLEEYCSLEEEMQLIVDRLLMTT